MLTDWSRQPLRILIKDDRKKQNEKYPQITPNELIECNIFSTVLSSNDYTNNSQSVLKDDYMPDALDKMIRQLIMIKQKPFYG